MPRTKYRPTWVAEQVRRNNASDALFPDDPMLYKSGRARAELQAAREKLERVKP